MAGPVRGTRYAYATAETAPPGYEAHQNALRDVLPDRPFKLHGYHLYMNNLTAEMLEIQLYKNIAASGGPVKGGPVLVTHGVMAEVALYTVDILNSTYVFEPAISFDRDDALTIMYQWGQQAAGMHGTMEITLLWSEG